MLRHGRETIRGAEDAKVKKWIVGAVFVGAAVVAVAVLTKPGKAPKEGEGSQVLNAKSPSARLASQNEKLKEISRKLAEERAAKKKLELPARAAPPPRATEDPAAKVLADAMQGPFSQTGFVPKDPAKHAQSNDIVKAKDELGVRIDPALRPKSTPNWDSVVPIDWKRLTQLYTGFSIGRNAGGDFNVNVVRELNGAAVEIEGAVMPIDPIGPNGELKRFWLARPAVVTAGCVFCKAPSLGDLVYVTTRGAPMKVDREKLYSGVIIAKVVGRFELGPTAAKDGTEYLFGLELKKEK